MKMEYKIKGGQNYFTLIYDEDEWEKQKEVFSGMHLSDSITSNRALGREVLHLKYYQVSDNDEYLNYIKEKLSHSENRAARDLKNALTDNINAPIVDEAGKLNVAIFRAIPEHQGNKYVVNIPIDQNSEMTNYVKLEPAIQAVYEVTQGSLVGVTMILQKREPIL